MSSLLSFLMMRALPVRWWSVLVVVVILVLVGLEKFQSWLTQVSPMMTPTYRIERIEAGVLGKPAGSRQPDPNVTPP